jgi:lipid-binding SYLF domain-containing protein
MKPVLTIALCLSLLIGTSGGAEGKFTDAVQRSKDSARIIELLSVVSEGGLAKELVEKSQAIGVFPKVEKGSGLFVQAMDGSGVISSRVGNKWSMPAFYKFQSAGVGGLFAKSDIFSVILLFMTKEATSGFEKGGIALKGKRRATAGPVGSINDEQRKLVADSHILAYTYFNGKLTGANFGESFWKKFMLDPDNNINTPLYGIKGREVLAGKPANKVSYPDGISAFQEALQKYFPN